MAKDDYEVIAYRILVYLYACAKRKIIFKPETFQAAVSKNVESTEYLCFVLRTMQKEGLIDGVAFMKAWGGDYILVSDLRDADITADGIRYLKENSNMKKIGETLKESVDIIAKLAGIIPLF